MPPQLQSRCPWRVPFAAACRIALAVLCATAAAGREARAESAGESSRSPEYIEELALTHLRYGQLNEAQSLLTEAGALAKKPGAKSRLLRRAGEVAASRRSWAEAVALLRQSADAAPEADAKADCVELLGQTYEDKREPEQALSVYADGLKLPAKPAARWRLQRHIVEIHRKLGNLDDMTQRWEAAAAGTPPDIGSIEMLCAAYEYARRDHAKAAEWLAKLSSAKKFCAEEERRLAQECERSGNLALAATTYGKLTELDPADRQFYLVRAAEVNAALGRREDALAAAKRLQALEPPGILAQQVTASVYVRLNDPASAAKYLQESIAKPRCDADRIDMTFLLARTYRDARDYANSEVWLRKLIAEPQPRVQDRARRRLFDLYDEQNKLKELKLP